MKRRSALGVALGFVAAIAFAGSTQAAFTGLTNGSFETGTYLGGGSGFQQLDAPNASINDWTVDAGSVDWIRTYWPASDGDMSIDMSGADAGTLSQTFDTVIGNTYTVTFDLSGNPAGPPDVKTLDVSATGGTTTSYVYDVTGNDLGTMNWTEASYSFLATSANTTLTFTSTTATAFGPAIDNVIVTEDAATKDDCKNGGWVTMLDTSGNGFKNQGDCVSFFATKGKNLGAVPPVTAAAASGAAADSTTTSVKKSDKQVEKASTQIKKNAKNKSQTEKVKAKSHAGKGRGSGSKKSK